jgi:hypothetical protein
MRRLLPVVEQNWPEMADRYMQVPLDYYHDEALAAKEREIFETQPLALIAASETAGPHDFVLPLSWLELRYEGTPRGPTSARSIRGLGCV